MVTASFPYRVSADEPLDGSKVFQRFCAACHALTPDQTATGPSLAGIVGRKAGSVAGYEYSPATRDSGLVWDPGTLDAYLADPKTVIPGTNMAFFGVRKAAERAALIEFLKTQKAPAD